METPKFKDRIFIFLVENEADGVTELSEDGRGKTDGSFCLPSKPQTWQGRSEDAISIASLGKPRACISLKRNVWGGGYILSTGTVKMFGSSITYAKTLQFKSFKLESCSYLKAFEQRSEST